MSKSVCACCGNPLAPWSFQPFGPWLDEFVFSAVKDRAIGWPSIRMCDSCKAIAEDSQTDWVQFTYKGGTYRTQMGSLETVVEAPDINK